MFGSINGGNTTLSAGNIKTDGQRRNIRIIGEIERPEDLENFVVKSENGAIFLKDIATVRYKEKQKTSFARSLQTPAVLLDVSKRGGKNLIEASNEINRIVSETKARYFPSDLNVTISNDQSEMTLNQVSDLVNNIIFGVILVVTVLMFSSGSAMRFCGLCHPHVHVYVVYDFIGPGLYHEYHGAFWTGYGSGNVG